MATTLDDIVETFELLGDWDARYEYLAELGEKMPPLAQEDYDEANRVKECMSQVWIRALRDPDNPELINFRGDCDTSIIKGVVALMIDLHSGRTNEDIQALDMDEIFERLDLAEHLSPNRHVGVYALDKMMKAKANELVAENKQVA